MSQEEKLIEEFWKMMEGCQFVKSTDSITDEVKEFPPAITDMEATVKIDGEFDKYAIEEWILSKAYRAGKLAGFEVCEKFPHDFMINEFIEKEIEKRVGSWEKMLNLNLKYFNDSGRQCSLCGINPSELKTELKNFAQTIAKEVAMKFKEEPDFDTDKEDECFGYNLCLIDKNALADQIINEVSP